MGTFNQDHSDLHFPVSNALIKRCAQAYDSDEEMIARLVAEGIEESIAFLAVKAGRVFSKDG